MPKPQSIQQWEAGKQVIPGNYIATINKALELILDNLSRSKL